MKFEAKIVIAIDDLADALCEQNEITQEEKDRLAFALFDTDYNNDCCKPFRLDWDLKELSHFIKTNDWTDNWEYLRSTEIQYAAQAFLQKEFPNVDSVLIDVSW